VEECTVREATFCGMHSTATLDAVNQAESRPQVYEPDDNGKNPAV